MASLKDSIASVLGIGKYAGDIDSAYYDGPNDEYVAIIAGKTHRIPASMIDRSYQPPPWANMALNNVTKSPSVLGQVLESENYRQRLLYMRLRIPEGSKHPYEYLSSHLSGDKVYVFVVQDGQAVTLEDAATMFPSDQLITQLRLLDK